jgi:hypothetical protein
MKIEDVRKLSPEGRFLYWVGERWNILSKRRSGYVRPWTNDKILQSYYFTNVKRKDDKVTIWVTENIIGPMQWDPLVIFAVLAFRWFNQPQPSGEYLVSHDLLKLWNCELAVKGLTGFKNAGLKVFTGAFNISNGGSSKPKVNRVCEDYIQPVWECRENLLNRILEPKERTLARAFEVISEYPGMGGSGFMAAQVVCDLAYTHFLEDAKDFETWCSWGPGSRRGMNRVCGFDENFPMPAGDWNVRLQRLRGVISRKLGLNLHARDVQNCLCEFSKYERALWNQGHLKRRYKGA